MYSRTPVIRSPSESHWCGRIRGMVAREGFVYKQKALSATRNVVVYERDGRWWRWSFRQGFYCSSILWPAWKKDDICINKRRVFRWNDWQYRRRVTPILLSSPGPFLHCFFYVLACGTGVARIFVWGHPVDVSRPCISRAYVWSWESVSAAEVSRVMGGAPEWIKNIGEITFRGGFL